MAFGEGAETTTRPNDLYERSLTNNGPATGRHGHHPSRFGNLEANRGGGPLGCRVQTDRAGDQVRPGIPGCQQPLPPRGPPRYARSRPGSKRTGRQRPLISYDATASASSPLIAGMYVTVDSDRAARGCSRPGN